MKHRLVAQLDRQIRLRGESLQLRRMIAGTSRHRLNLKGIVKTNGQAQLIAGITAPKYIIVISPTALKEKPWSGGLGATSFTPNDGTTPDRDEDIPTTSDSIVVRQNQLAIARVDPIYDGDTCVRIELQVSG